MDVILETLRRIPLFADLEPDLLRSLSEVCDIRTYAKRDYICRADEHSHMLFCLLEGLVQLGLTHADGKETGLLLLEPGQWFGELALLDGRYQPASIMALEESRAMVLPRGPFLRLVQEDHGLALGMLTVSQRRLYHILEHIKRVQSGTPFQRLARILLALAKDYGEETPEGPRIRLRLTHQVLADLSGLRRETITQTLTAFRRTNCLKVEAQRFLLTDRRRIEREAE